MFLNNLKNRLHSHAVPSLLNVPNPPPVVASQRKPPKPRNCATVDLSFVADSAAGQELIEGAPSVQLNADTSMSSGPSDSEYIVKLKGILNRQRVEIHRLKKRNPVLMQQLKDAENSNYMESLCNKYLPKKMKDFVMMFEKGKNTSGQNKHDIKAMTLGLYFLSPKAYSFVCNFVPLPSPRTIRRILSNLPITTGISEWILKNLEMKVNVMGESSKHCIICIDEMSLKSHLYYNISKDEVIGVLDMGEGNRGATTARAALVLMVRGIVDNWKQAIHYFLIKDSCPAGNHKEILFDAIRKLYALGMKVHGVVSDMGTNFQQLTKMLDVTPCQPYFSVDGNQFFYIFDVPHLMKSVRNNLMAHDFHFKEHVASWNDVVSLYNKDKQQSLRLAVKLTEAIINPNNFMKMKVKYATKVFSHTVAAALETHVRIGKIPNSAIGTVKLLAHFDKLFDCLNSSSLRSKTFYRSAISADSHHIEFLKESLEFIKGIQVFSKEGRCVTNRVKCLYGWKMSISAILCLWERIRKLPNISFLLTCRLNQDPLENFFGDIRKQGGNCDHPSPIAFQSAFKKLLLTSIKNPFANGNCLTDIDSFLTHMDSFTTIICKGNSHELPMLCVKTHDYRHQLLQENAEVYVAGYIMKKCLQQHSCQFCLTYSKENDMMVDPSQIYSMMKSYSIDSFGGLSMPNRLFVDFISEMNTLFERKFPGIFWETKLGCKILEELNDISFELPCPEFPIAYCKKLFIRMKLYHSIRNTNKIPKGNCRKVRKVTKVNAAT